MRISVLALLLVTSLTAIGATTDITWTSTNASPPPNLPRQQAGWLPTFRSALALLPESAVVSMALSQPQVLGLSSDETRALGPLVAKQYELIVADAELAAAPSHLAYCFSEARPKHGLARLSNPANSNANTPVIVFLHGYGGSFLWYHRWIRSTFPDHIVISPAYGINTAAIPPAYLRECQEQAARALGHRLAKPVIIGLSAGGFGAARVHASAPLDYRSAIVLAAYPPPDMPNSGGSRLDLRFLAGGAEYYVRDGTWSRSLDQLSRSGVRITGEIIPNAGHFFLLTHETETRAWLATQSENPGK